MNTPIHRRPEFALAIAFIAFAVGFRLFRVTLLPDLPNFSPVMAVALCAALILPGAYAMVIPLAALVISDIALNLFYGCPAIGWDDLVRASSYGLAVACGLVLRRMNAGIGLTLAAVVGNSLLFYLVSNSLAWVASPDYARTAAGWVQALTVGVPGFPPTWTFLKWSIAGDVLFTVMFLAAIRLTVRPRVPQPA